VITETVGGVSVVLISTESLIVSNAEQFKNEISPLLVQNCRIVMDMSKLRFVDSSGIGALLSCLKKIQALGGQLKICSLTDQVRSILQLVRVNKLLEIFSTREEAVSSFEE